MSQKLRTLVCTLHSGENEFKQCVASLQAQSYQNWEHRVFENLPNREAHDTLYREFMNYSKSFDVFLKLDADMVFMSENSLAEIVRLFAGSDELDLLTSAVYDWYSDSLIMGLNAFSSRVTWQVNDDLFVDRGTSIAGSRVILRDSPAPFVWHSPNPTKLQAFKFGVHRSSKVVQRHSNSFHVGQARIQWDILTRTWHHFRSTMDARLGLALLGAEYVFQGEVDHSWYAADRARRTVIQFERCKDNTAVELLAILHPRWSHGILRILRFAVLTARPRLYRKMLGYLESHHF